MKNCFMKKLLSSFLALTMVVTVVPANVVSAAGAQTQVVKNDQNKQSQTKKASYWSDKTKTGLIAGCAAFLLAAVQASLYFKLNLAEKAIEELNKTTTNQTNEEFNAQFKKAMEELKTMTANQTDEEFNAQFEKAIKEIKMATNQTNEEIKTQLEGTIKLLSEELSQAKAQINSLANNANMAATQVDINAGGSGLSKTNGLLYGAEGVGSYLFLRRVFREGKKQLKVAPPFQVLYCLFYIGVEMLIHSDEFWNGAKYIAGKTWDGTKYGFGKSWNATSAFFGNLFKGNNSTLTNITKAGTEEKKNTKSGPSPKPEPTPALTPPPMPTR